MFWCRRRGLLRQWFGIMNCLRAFWCSGAAGGGSCGSCLAVSSFSKASWIIWILFTIVASTHFSDLLQILQKSGQFFPKLDQKQEFFLDGPHNRKLSQHNKGATVLIMYPIIQLARKSADIYRISAFWQISMGGRSTKFPAYDPTRAESNKNDAQMVAEPPPQPLNRQNGVAPPESSSIPWNRSKLPFNPFRQFFPLKR